ncbi:MAG: ABC transporter permease [Proteobacteria bacterium]|nr:ABC transporter permease [Pseudomonadota bacterium]
MPETIIIYEPDNSLKKGYLSIFNEIFIEIKKNRWLIYQLFKRDFLASYKQTFIGIFWTFLLPIISLGVFIILNSSGVFIVGNVNAPYPLYAMLGLAFWQIFSTGLVACSNSLVNAGSMIIKINFSKKSLVFSSIGQPLLSFSIQMLIVICLFVFYGIMPSLMILWLPFLLLPILLFTIGLGLILSLINGVMRDIGNMLSVFVTFMMFLTPVVYAKPSEGILASITIYNPIYYFISAPRELILTGKMIESNGFFISGIFSVLIFIVCITVFHLTETRVAERV